MAVNVVLDQRKGLEDRVVGKIVDLGCACATRLATEFGHGVTADDLLETLESLEARGVLRHKVDSDDPRKYSDRYQTDYELAG